MRNHLVVSPHVSSSWCDMRGCRPRRKCVFYDELLILQWIVRKVGMFLLWTYFFVQTVFCRTVCFTFTGKRLAEGIRWYCFTEKYPIYGYIPEQYVGCIVEGQTNYYRYPLAQSRKHLEPYVLVNLPWSCFWQQKVWRRTFSPLTYLYLVSGIIRHVDGYFHRYCWLGW